MRIIGIAGWSGAGKTTLISKLIPALLARGRTVSTLKHAHHRFDIDHPGKDSYAHRMAGSTEVIVSSASRFALIHELRDAPEWTLEQLLSKLSPVDLVVIEGFKRDPHPKIEVFRAANGKPPLHPEDEMIRAIATDQPFPASALAQAGLDDIEAIATLADQLAAPLDQVFGR
jgi:molybdopterin-guanine dinucleotide biosynthesis adapter protein